MPYGSQDPPNNNSVAAYATNLVIKASKGALIALTGYNSGPAQWIQLHDAVSLPANAAVPVLIYNIATLSSFNLDFGQYGKAFQVGIVVCNSTTGPTKTIGAADCWFEARYV